MQSTVRSETPHAADLRSLSSKSVHINREVTIVSSPSPNPVVKRTRYSYMPSIQNDHSRPQSSPGPATGAAADAPLNQWNSQSKASNRSSARYSRSSFPRSFHDQAALENNRESMKALSEFLMTRDPPPNNWISVQSDDERSLNSVKRSSFKLFRALKSKKQKSPRFLQLPDSAVAAKTRNGARHIAISIPIEHDYIEVPKVQRAPLPPLQIPLLRNLSVDRLDRSAVTILKPVAEVRESGSSYLSSVPKSRNSATESNHIQQESITTAPSEVLDPDATKTVQDYYTGLDQVQKSQKQEPSLTKFDLARAQKSYIAVSPVRQDSQRSDPRHSGGTAYSTASLATFQGHSRAPSSVSSAPSATLISPLNLDLPPRKSSMVKIPTTVNLELSQTSKFPNEIIQEEPLSSVRSEPSEATTVTSKAISTPSPPLVFNTAKAEIVRRYSAADGPHIIRSLTPKGISPAPSKKLSSTPSLHGLSRSKTAPPFQARPTAMVQLKEAGARHARDGTNESLRVTRQSRQERVKARKLRDIERLRSKSGIRAPLTETVLPPNTQETLKPLTTTKIATPPRNPKRNDPSYELEKKKAANSITPIMLVANLAPYTGLVLLSDLPTPRTLGKPSNSTNSDSNKTPTCSATCTPPRSLSPSSSENSPIHSSRTRSRRTKVGEGKILSPTGSLLESRRRERRMKRNLRERDKELDDRLGRIERDNRLLMSTLTGIANSFGELSRRVEKGSSGFGTEFRAVRRMVGDGGVGELKGIEPVMRELQVLAPRVSIESVKGVGDGYNKS